MRVLYTPTVTGDGRDEWLVSDRQTGQGGGVQLSWCGGVRCGRPCQKAGERVGHRGAAASVMTTVDGRDI